MQLSVVGVGRVKEPYLQDGIREYCTRIRPYFNLSLHDVAEERVPAGLTPAEREGVLEREGVRMLAFCREGGIVVALDVGGELWSSQDLAARLRSWVLEGRNEVSFLIGGPLGISGTVRGSARHTLSLSRMTFPHQMVRLILLEQIYRAAKICRGEPYHK